MMATVVLSKDKYLQGIHNYHAYFGQGESTLEVSQRRATSAGAPHSFPRLASSPAPASGGSVCTPSLCTALLHHMPKPP